MRKPAMMILSVVLYFSFATFAGQDKEPNNFDLFRQGKVVASIQKMNQELWKQQFPTRQLNRMLSRLNSSFETNMGISSDLYAKALDKIRKQKSADGLEMDPDILYVEFTSITKGPISIDQVENLVNSTVRSAEGDQKTLRLLVLKMIANRIYIKTKDLKALYVAGKAGYHRFNTGKQQLQDFDSICETKPRQADCQKYRDSVQRMLVRSAGMELNN